MGDTMKYHCPLDIQQMVFQREASRGYDREEVNRFLEEVAQTVEYVEPGQCALREKLVFMEQQVAGSTNAPNPRYRTRSCRRRSIWPKM